MQICFVGGHIALTIVAILFIIGGFVLPAVSLIMSRKLQRGENINVMSEAVVSITTNEFKEEQYWFGGASIFFVCTP